VTNILVFGGKHQVQVTIIFPISLHNVKDRTRFSALQSLRPSLSSSGASAQASLEVYVTRL